MEEFRRSQRKIFRGTSVTAPVAVRGVGKHYDSGHEPVAVLSDITLTLDAGTMTALVGPSGCGKSTLLNLIGCVDLPSSGEIVIDGIATHTLDDNALTKLRRDKVGTIFQSFHLIGALTLAENIAIPLLLSGYEQREVERRVNAVMELVGIVDRADALPSQASGGQQQRAAIARAIVRGPAVLLADEPTGSLDSKNGEIVMNILRELADGGQTILLATHSLEAAARCDRTVTMRDGRIVDATLV